MAQATMTRVVLARHISGAPAPGDFRVETVPTLEPVRIGGAA